MELIGTLVRMVDNTDSSAQSLSQLRDELNAQSQLIHRKMREFSGNLDAQSVLVNQKFNYLIGLAQAQTQLMRAQVNMLESLEMVQAPPPVVADNADAFQRPPGSKRKNR